jgi:hypothetical protein
MMGLDNFFEVLNRIQSQLAVNAETISILLLKTIRSRTNYDISEVKRNEQSNTDASMKHTKHRVKHTSSADKVPELLKVGTLCRYRIPYCLYF